MCFVQQLAVNCYYGAVSPVKLIRGLVLWMNYHICSTFFLNLFVSSVTRK
jgi:hypothetical protein